MLLAREVDQRGSQQRSFTPEVISQHYASAGISDGKRQVHGAIRFLLSVHRGLSWHPHQFER